MPRAPQHRRPACSPLHCAFVCAFEKRKKDPRKAARKCFSWLLPNHFPGLGVGDRTNTHHTVCNFTPTIRTCAATALLGAAPQLVAPHSPSSHRTHPPLPASPRLSLPITHTATFAHDGSHLSTRSPFARLSLLLPCPHTCSQSCHRWTHPAYRRYSLQHSGHQDSPSPTRTTVSEDPRWPQLLPTVVAILLCLEVSVTPLALSLSLPLRNAPSITCHLYSSTSRSLTHSIHPFLLSLPRPCNRFCPVYVCVDSSCLHIRLRFSPTANLSISSLPPHARSSFNPAPTAMSLRVLQCDACAPCIQCRKRVAP